MAEYNPRQLTKEQHAQLKDSIQRFGLVDPLIVNKNKDRDKLYDTRIADLTAGWDTQRSMYDTSLSNLSGQLGQQQQAYGNLSSEFAQQRQDWDTQRSAYDTSLSNLNKSISDYQAREQARQEQMAIEAQRARTAAAYGRQGEPMNPSVTGVKTQRGLTDPRRNRYGSSFKRSDMTIVNKQLNI